MPRIPGNAEWERSLSVANSLIGDVMVTQGNLTAALKVYRDVLAVAVRLAKAHPDNRADATRSVDRV